VLNTWAVQRAARAEPAGFSTTSPARHAVPAPPGSGTTGLSGTPKAASAAAGTITQNRVDCVRLAAGKTAAWWLRRHDVIRGLPAPPEMPRQDRLNWQLRMADADMTPPQRREFDALFGSAGPELTAADRTGWLARLDEVSLVSDGYLPFRDNSDEASRVGVRYVIEPGGASRAADVEAACASTA
jgi:phosphoribosylaminoimidazolecarboxamide formyltransferase / IMP cyclohydrolase